MINTIEKMGIFLTKKRFVKATQLDEMEEIIDKNGEKFVGLPGDWKIIDENGYIYFISKWKFKELYQPYNDAAFDMYIKL